MSRKYKVLWLDDDFSSNRDDSLSLHKEWMEANTELAFTTVTNAADFKVFPLNSFEAIILDVRFPKEYNGDNSQLTGGFYSAALHINKSRYDGPIFIVSAEPSVTSRENEAFVNSIELLGLTRDDIYDKGEFIKKRNYYCKLFIEKIQTSNSILHKLRSVYSDAFNAVEQIGIEETLISLLTDCELFCCNSSADKLTAMLTSVRSVLERMMTALCNKNILPSFLDSPNQMKNLFLYGSDRESCVTLTEEGRSLMSQTVATQLGYITDISNDAHHSKKRLAIHVNDYLREEPDEQFVHASILMLTSVLKWYSKNCLTIMRADDDRFWTGGCYAQKVRVQKNKYDQYFVDYYRTDGTLNKILIYYADKDNKICKDMDGQMIEEGDLINITAKPKDKESGVFNSTTTKSFILKIEE